MLKFEKLIFGDLGWGDEFLIAMLMTILVSILAMCLGIILAIFTAWAKVSYSKVLSIIANFYTTIVRGIPELLVIYLIFFGGSALLMKIAKIFGYNGYIELNALVISIIAIGIISATYSSEVLRAAYLSVPKGQVEAAKSLGLSRWNTFYKILSPQILRHAIPGIGNVWQITLKDTSLISVTGLVEIMRMSYIAAGSTRDPLFFYSFAAVLYLFLTFLSMKLFNKLEKHYSRGH